MTHRIHIYICVYHCMYTIVCIRVLGAAQRDQWEQDNGKEELHDVTITSPCPDSPSFHGVTRRLDRHLRDLWEVTLNLISTQPTHIAHNQHTTNTHSHNQHTFTQPTHIHPTNTHSPNQHTLHTSRSTTTASHWHPIEVGLGIEVVVEKTPFVVRQ